MIPDIAPEAVLDFVDNGVAQGYTEGSNVNPMLELTRLISVTRSFESASTAVEQSDRTLQEAIRTLGDTR